MCRRYEKCLEKDVQLMQKNIDLMDAKKGGEEVNDEILFHIIVKEDLDKKSFDFLCKILKLLKNCFYYVLDYLIIMKIK